MLETISPEQFNEWLAEYTIEPWGIEPFAEVEEKPKGNGLAAMRSRIGV
jgi:hypothetical protein